VDPKGTAARELLVHLLHRPDADSLEHLRAHLDGGIRVTLGSELPQPSQFHVLVAGRPQRQHIVASPNLRALIIPWAGLPETTRNLMRRFPRVAVHNLHYNAGIVAEMALTLLLAAAKAIVPADRLLRSHDWTPRYHKERPVLLNGKTALVLGYGTIGREVARLCRALGMQVLATRRIAAQAPSDDVDEVHAPDALHRLLPRAHVVIICLPHTSETTGLVGERELSLLPPRAILVNVGRGPIVDERALYQALRTGALHAAGLDVWYNYPTDEATRSHTPPSSFPFHALDNVVMSPHRAGHVGPTEQLRMEHVAASLNAAARGEEIPHRVDLDAGY
jgi:phosphoglycerate dehydrogenase-like enzyme